VSIRCGIHPSNILLFERLERSLTSLISSIRHKAHTTPRKMKT
jgi:hypothetical protein